MRKTRANPPNRCYHLISRVAHRAFVLGDDEKTRLVDLIRRGAAMRSNSYCGNLLWHSSQTLRCPGIDVPEGSGKVDISARLPNFERQNPKDMADQLQEMGGVELTNGNAGYWDWKKEKWK